MDRDLSSVADNMGVRVETLRRQYEQNLDNPSYRYDRDTALFSFLRGERVRLEGSSWLDVGADTGAMSVYLSEILKSNTFELCDVNAASRTNFPVRKIEGVALDYESNSFDLVLFIYVLHHAGNNAIQLLRDAHRIARKLVIVAEDPKDTDRDCRWAYQDDQRGTFRGQKEWKELFTLLGYYTVLEQPLDCHVHSRHLFVLAPNEQNRHTDNVSSASPSADSSQGHSWLQGGGLGSA